MVTVGLRAFIDNTSASQLDENDENSELPPAYEHPPDYEEASSIKFEICPWHMDQEQSSRKRSRSRSRSRCCFLFSQLMM